MPWALSISSSVAKREPRRFHPARPSFSFLSYVFFQHRDTELQSFSLGFTMRRLNVFVCLFILSQENLEISTLFATFAETKRKTMALLIRRHTHPLLAHWLRKGFRMGLLKIQGVFHHYDCFKFLVVGPLVRENRWGKEDSSS